MEVKVIASKQVYEGVISLRKDKFSLNGRVVEKEIVEHPPSVGIIAIATENYGSNSDGQEEEKEREKHTSRKDDIEIILVNQYRRAPDRSLLEIPAGKIEEGETPEQAAAREMDEEIGCKGVLTPFLKWYLAPGYDTEIMHVFIANKLARLTSRRDMDDDEDITSRKIRLGTAVRMCLNGEIEDAKTIAAILAFASKPL